MSEHEGSDVEQVPGSDVEQTPSAPAPRPFASDPFGHSTPMTVVVDQGTPPPPLPAAQPQPDAVAPTASTVTPPNGTAIPEEDEPV
ncbi:hypothetical protein ACFU76_07905 [Streptomyces sp. NPDC057539]|uniref:hypothetical protein n=1 Tax=Streptomyces sp. NPDC057539 TaxID=3346159 RepID=UPI0036738DBD